MKIISFTVFRTFALLAMLVGATLPAGGEDGLRVSAYATAGDVLRYLVTAPDREAVAQTCARLRVARVFLEGRRGDEYVPPTLLAEARDFLAAKGIEVAGGIATVPGASFGKRQNGALTWLNWEDVKTRRDMAGFFTENAPVFHELIVDDMFCTADTSPDSERARGSRSWSVYRRDLLNSSIQPLIVAPARAARPSVRLILKFPQWYDRFHLFGYDPARMMASFDQIWVGTEVRDPRTRRMGYVQPTEGYMNFRWLAANGGDKVVGAWFDHIECSGQNFLDQAYGSVLAGARELTLFHLGDLMEGHPGDALLASRLPELIDLEKRLRGQRRDGIAYYKPAGGDGDENLYLMDYLGMLGLPILPAAGYPEGARVVFLGVQAAADPEMDGHLSRHLRRGGTVVMTPAFVRRAGSAAGHWAGVKASPVSQPSYANTVEMGRRAIPLTAPLEVDSSLAADGCQVLIAARSAGGVIPVLTSHRSGGGRVLVLNVRTFSETDFRQSGEWLLAPKPLGWSQLPQSVADRVREAMLDPLGIRFQAPAAVSLCLFAEGCCLYNFLDQPVEVRLDGARLRLGANQCLWKPLARPRSMMKGGGGKGRGNSSTVAR